MGTNSVFNWIIINDPKVIYFHQSLLKQIYMVINIIFTQCSKKKCIFFYMCCCLLLIRCCWILLYTLFFHLNVDFQPSSTCFQNHPVIVTTISTVFLHHFQACQGEECLASAQGRALQSKKTSGRTRREYIVCAKQTWYWMSWDKCTQGCSSKGKLSYFSPWWVSLLRLWIMVRGNTFVCVCSVW